MKADGYDRKFDPLHDSCPVRAALDVIRGRWKPSLLLQLRFSTKRFSELQAALPGITPQALTVQLRQLEADGIISRKVYPEIPVRVEYAFTEYGLSLAGVMDQLETWGLDYLQRQHRAKAATPKRRQA